MNDDNPNEAREGIPTKPDPLQAECERFLITASELRDRKIKRRRKPEELAEAVRFLAVGLKAKAK